MQICSPINFPRVKFPPANPPSTPLKKPPKNSSAQKSIFKLLKPQIEQTLVLPESPPPPTPPLFFLAFFLLVFFLGVSSSIYQNPQKHQKWYFNHLEPSARENFAWRDNRIFWAENGMSDCSFCVFCHHAYVCPASFFSLLFSNSLSNT